MLVSRSMCLAHTSAAGADIKMRLWLQDPSVLFISSHQDGLFPMTGKLKEAGAGAGEGYTINIPIPGETACPCSYMRGQEDLHLCSLISISGPHTAVCHVKHVLNAWISTHGSNPLGGECVRYGSACMTSCTGLRVDAVQLRLAQPQAAAVLSPRTLHMSAEAPALVQGMAMRQLLQALGRAERSWACLRR